MKLVPVNQTRLAQLQDQATTWYRGLGAARTATEDGEEPEPENRFLTLLKKYGETWYVQIGFAISYIFLLRGVTDYLDGTGDDDEDEDDDE